MATANVKDVLQGLREGNDIVVVANNLEHLDAQVGITGVSDGILYATNGAPYVQLSLKGGKIINVFMSKRVKEDIGEGATDIAVVMDYPISYSDFNQRDNYKFVSKQGTGEAKNVLKSFKDILAASKAPSMQNS